MQMKHQAQIEVFEPPHIPSDLELAFQRYDEKHPQVWEKFVEFAFKAINRGYTHYGAKTIFEAIRFHSDVTAKGEPFKICNSYTPYYARKFMRVYPQYKDFFETREVKP